MMKQWKEPEMSVFSVRMTENIAASGDVGGGDVGGGYDVLYLWYAEGPITRGGAYYRCKGTAVQDTGVNYYAYGADNVIAKNDVSAVSGCMA